MPTKQVDSAVFEPIPPDLDLPALVEQSENFHFVIRISARMIEEQGPEAFDQLVRLHVVKGGKPLVIEHFHLNLPAWMFGSQWLMENMNTKHEVVRDLKEHQNVNMSIGHYLRNMGRLARRIRPNHWKGESIQRLYLKDIDCPESWYRELKNVVPPGLFYLNESTGDVGGPGAMDEPAGIFGGPAKRGRGIAPAGDLMSCLPPEMRAENMMCYIGHEGTYTPAHREMCASLGQNLMVETSGTELGEDGQPEQAGSSIWFMTESKDRKLLSEYWISKLGHDIEVESHFAQIAAWQNAPFPVYVVEQKVGDFILIPPLAPHQVWNRGTRTMKVAWNRTTVETLELAIDEALPRARMVCRDEQYKNKAIIFYALKKYSKLLERVHGPKSNSWNTTSVEEFRRNRKVRTLEREFVQLFQLYSKILTTEMFGNEAEAPQTIEYVPFESHVTCAYCRCNIFNRFLTCKNKKCILVDEASGEEDGYDVCMDCFAMGRSCACISGLKWVEQFKWKELSDKYEDWRMLVIEIQGGVTSSSPNSLQERRRQCQNKTLAEVVNEQLNLRPYRDPTKEPPKSKAQMRKEEELNEDPLIDSEGRRKRRKTYIRSEKWKQEFSNCHVCKTRDEKWRLAHCSCGVSYCYGVLFRAFDLMPLDVMENPDWKCPLCLGICNCGACRRLGNANAYHPVGTLIGHDTKRVADVRSVEALVDFSRANLNWLTDLRDGRVEEESHRIRSLRQEAEWNKAQDATLEESDEDDNNMIDDNREEDMEDAPHEMDDSVIDPSLHNPLIATDFSPDSDLQPRTHRRHASHRNDQLPPPSAMLGGAPATQTSSHSYSPDTQTSRLERDPQAFMDALGQVSPPNSFAPVANMGYDSQGVRTDPDTGIRYSYPDSPGANSNQHFYPSRPTSKSGQENGTVSQLPLQNNKRKRDDPFESNITPGTLTDANRKYLDAQRQRKLAKAKRDGHFYRTRAKLDGVPPCVVTLYLTPERFQEKIKALEDSDKAKGMRPMGFDGAFDDDDSFVVISDIRPLDKLERQDSTSGLEESSTIKSRNAKLSSAFTHVNGVDKIDAGEFMGASDAEMGIDNIDDAEQVEVISKNIHRDRKQSAYLRRRQQENGDADLPTELPSPISKRNPSRKIQTPADVQVQPSINFDEDLTRDTVDTQPATRTAGKTLLTSFTKYDSHSDNDFEEVDENYNIVFPLKPVFAASGALIDDRNSQSLTPKASTPAGKPSPLRPSRKIGSPSTKSRAVSIKEVTKVISPIVAKPESQTSIVSPKFVQSQRLKSSFSTHQRLQKSVTTTASLKMALLEGTSDGEEPPVKLAPALNLKSTSRSSLPAKFSPVNTKTPGTMKGPSTTKPGFRGNSVQVVSHKIKEVQPFEVISRSSTTKNRFADSPPPRSSILFQSKVSLMENANESDDSSDSSSGPDIIPATKTVMPIRSPRTIKKDGLRGSLRSSGGTRDLSINWSKRPEAKKRDWRMAIG